MMKSIATRYWCFTAIEIAFSCLLLLSVGCGTSNPDGRIPVSGTVKLAGEPVQTGYIMFVSTSGGKSSGGKIADGGFELSADKGIPKGSYKVKITGERASGKKIPDSDYPDQLIDDIEQYIPDRYNSKTELTLDVDGPMEPLEYELKAD